jgi:hypothetical protein
VRDAKQNNIEKGKRERIAHVTSSSSSRSLALERNTSGLGEVERELSLAFRHEI